MSVLMREFPEAVLAEAPSIASPLEAEVEQAVREHSRLVYRIAYSVLGNRDDAEDVVQETFLKYLRGRKSIREARAWLARTAWHAALDRRRRPQEVSVEEAAEAVRGLRATGAGVDEIAADRQMLALLDRLIAALPKKLREALVLLTVSELSSVEVARVLGIPEGSVRTRALRARQILKEKLTAVVEVTRGRS